MPVPQQIDGLSQCRRRVGPRLWVLAGAAAALLALAVAILLVAAAGHAQPVNLMTLAPEPAQRAMLLPQRLPVAAAPAATATTTDVIGVEPVAAAAVVSSSPAVVLAARGDTGPTFNHRPLRKARTLRMLCTAYSPDARSCGKWADGITASGYSVWTNGMKLVAADTRLLPFGSVISIPGYDAGKPVPVLDRGGKIKGHRLDLLFPTHEAALQWGVRAIEVTVWEYAD